MEYKKSFSILEAFRYGFETLFKEFLFFVQLFSVHFLLMLFGSFVVVPKLTHLIQTARNAQTLQPHLIFAIALIILLYWVLATLAMWGIDEVCLEFVTTGKKSLNMILNPFSYLLKALAADMTFVALILSIVAVCYLPIQYVLSSLMPDNNVVMLVLLLLGALVASYVFTVFCFYRYIIIDTQCSIIDAFKKSATMTKGVRFPLFGLSLLVIVLNSVRMIPLIGSFFIEPLRILTSMDIYKKLSNNQNIPPL